MKKLLIICLLSLSTFAQGLKPGGGGTGTGTVDTTRVPSSSSSATNLVSYGATIGGNADVAIATFLASSAREVVIRSAFTLTNNVTLTSGYRMRFEQGGVLTVASGKTLTINGEVEAGNYQIFTGAGTVTFTTSCGNSSVNPMWWGALNSNTRSDDSMSAFNAAIASVPSSFSSRGMFILVPHGNYWISAPLTVPSSIDLRGAGKENTIIRATFATSGTLFPIPGNTKARFRDIQILNDTASTSTNIGISIGTSLANVSELELRDVAIKQWTANGVALTNVGRAKFLACLFQSNKNDPALSGTGTTIARAIFSGGTATLGGGSNYVTGLSIRDCNFSSNDRDIEIPFFTSLDVDHNHFEVGGDRLTTNNVSNIHVGTIAGEAFNFSNNYCEGNWNGTNTYFLKIENTHGATVVVNMLVDHLASLHHGNSMIGATGNCEGIIIKGNDFSGTQDKFIKNFSNCQIEAFPNSYDSAYGLFGTLTNWAQISPFIGGTNTVTFLAPNYTTTLTAPIVLGLDGLGAVLSSGNTAYSRRMETSGTIVRATTTSDVNGSITLEVWKKSSYPPTSADKISASAPITLSSTNYSTDTTLSGWTPLTFAEGDYIAISATGTPTTLTKVQVTLQYVKQ